MRWLAFLCLKKSAQGIENKGRVFALLVESCQCASSEALGDGTAEGVHALRETFFVNHGGQANYLSVHIEVFLGPISEEPCARSRREEGSLKTSSSSKGLATRPVKAFEAPQKDLLPCKSP